MGYYNPVTGRFTQEDPARDGLNYYTYCTNNPIMYIDPTGLASVSLVDYVTTMGGTVTPYTDKQGRPCVKVTANGVTQRYILNNGTIDDSLLNDKFGFTSVLTKDERKSGYTIGISNEEIFAISPSGTAIPRYERGYPYTPFVTPTITGIKEGVVVGTAIRLAVVVGGVVRSVIVYLADGGAATASITLAPLAANEANQMLSNVSPERIYHIMDEAQGHAWDLVGATDWSSVSNVINTTLTNGVGRAVYNGNAIYSLTINGQTVEVTTRIVNGVIQIVDAWVTTR